MFVIDLLREGLTVEQVNGLAMTYDIDINAITGIGSDGTEMAVVASAGVFHELLKECAA